MNHKTNQLRQKALVNAMLTGNVSVADLRRKTGFLKHQIQMAVSGAAAITPTTYEVLMRACDACSQERRDTVDRIGKALS
jgi:hypothetical protein